MAFRAKHGVIVYVNSEEAGPRHFSGNHISGTMPITTLGDNGFMDESDASNANHR
jgi:hypothetical protein